MEVNCDDKRLDQVVLVDDNNLSYEDKCKFLRYKFPLEHKMFIKEKLSTISWMEKISIRFDSWINGY